MFCTRTILKLKNIVKITFCFTFIQFSFGQNKKITIVDKSTNLPIENVNLTYLELNEGTFTNSNGIASLDLKKNDLKISMIGYEEISLTFEKANKIDTLVLSPSFIQLEEVIPNENIIYTNFDNWFFYVIFGLYYKSNHGACKNFGN
ncbi:carboxypeptidase-like regulatory domain-containing protein [Flavobacterium sp. K5-23]|uniref:carboxypeptidase-like regulatory domain-containing protein n=1 Tax=Flavobacterium sp. K5-23 TaxID=2746225 RepID=UPI002010B257|nr:carboxypeptidase-like regulatory domain-containing protein [Flavobacterium sp. K5-23]UQD57139.1 carboxypeptidase-like regulatory domain-containing protein [Flavobacterium sp. K5-23]